MPAVVFVDSQPGRSARVVCKECGLDDRRDRTAEAQDVASQHNLQEHS